MPYHRPIALYIKNGKGYTSIDIAHSITELIKEYKLNRNKVIDALNRAVGHKITDVQGTSYAIRDLTSEEKVEIYKKQGVM